MVAAARYELVHISTTATVTSRLPKGSPHIMKCIFFLYITLSVTGAPKAFALSERGWSALICPGLMGVSLSGYDLADAENF